VILLLDEFFLGGPALASVDIIARHGIKIGLTALDTDYALTSFITLNDRGKRLSVLERLKALWLQRAIVGGHGALVINIHRVFGDLYRTADRCVEVRLANTLDSAEDLLCQLLYHWLDMANPAHELWYGAEKVHEWFLAQPAPVAVANWVTTAEQLQNQLDHLCITYLDPAPPIAMAPSIHYPATSTLHEDYCALLVRVGLPPHLLALLLRFRQHFGGEWHERHPFTVAVNAQLIQPICDLLNAIGHHPLLNGYRQRIVARLPFNCGNAPDVENIVNANKSILEAVERIAVLAWGQGANPRVGFINLCAVTFAPLPPVHINGAIAAWYAFCNYSGPYDRYYLDTLCHRDAPNSQRYLLWEWERSLVELAGGPEILQCPQQAPLLELEHVLPAAWQNTINGAGHTFPQWGFRDEAHFQRNLLERIGNKALLWEHCNRAVGNNHPDIKAAHYVGGLCGHAPNAPSLKQIEQLGNDLRALGAGPSAVFKEYFELRCAELAVFALQRLC